MKKETKLTTLGAVNDAVDQMSQHCVDKYIPVPEISFENLDTMTIAGEPHQLRTVAQRSVVNRLGIPFNYIAKCPPEIQAENLNYWIKHEKNDQLFARFDGKNKEIRALFTTKYQPVDNFEVLERLDSSLCANVSETYTP